MAADYRSLAGYYSLLFPLNDRQREFFVHLRATASVETVLDVGCGTGEHLAWPLLPLRGEEVVQYLREAGVDDIREFGDYNRIAYAPDSPALILLGQRR